MYRIRPKDPDSRVKTHFVSNEALAKAIQEDLDMRFGESFDQDFALEKVERAHFDLGGSCFLNHLVLRFMLPNGSSVTVPDDAASTMLSLIRRDLDQNQVRVGAGIPYLKLHGHYSCICLTMTEWLVVISDLTQIEGWLAEQINERGRFPSADDFDQRKIEIRPGIFMEMHKHYADKRGLPE